MSNSYHKNLVFTAACIGMCFFGVSMITLGAVLPSLIAKLNLSGLQTTSLVTFLPLGMLAGSLIFGPIVDRFGHKALLVPSCIIVLLGMEGLAFFESVPLLQASIVGIGLGGGILNGETNALVSDISGESEKGSRLSFLGMFYGLGALGIPMLLGSLSRHYSFETILLGIGVVMLAGIIFCIPVRFPAPKQAQGFGKRGIGTAERKQLTATQLHSFFPKRHRGCLQQLVHELLWADDGYSGQSGIDCTDLHGSGTDRSTYDASCDIQEDKTGNRAALQPYAHCHRILFPYVLAGFCTCGSRHGAGRYGAVGHVSRDTQHSWKPVPVLIGNSIQRGACHSPHWPDCNERPDGNGFPIHQWHRTLSLSDDCLTCRHAPFV